MSAPSATTQPAAIGNYPLQADVLSASPIPDWIDKNFLRHDPYAFRDGSFRDFVFECSTSFNVDPNGVYCLGSGAIGLSLSPTKIDNGQLKYFDATSDLDIALISETHFDSAWRELRRLAHPAYNEVDAVLTKNLDWQRKRFFDGAILSNKLLPLLPFGGNWQTGLIRVAQSATQQLNREIDVNFWIYRDYWSVRSGVARSMIACRAALR